MFINYTLFAMKMCSSCSKRGKDASHGVSRLHVPFLRSQVSGKRGTAAPLQPGSCSELGQRAEPSGKRGLASSLCWKSLQLIEGSRLSTPVWSLVARPQGAPVGRSHPGDGMCWMRRSRS